MMLIVFLPFSLFLCGECLWESHALSSPFPFPLCVPRLSSPLCPPIPMSCLVFPTCVWCLPHTNTVPCCAASSPVFSFCVSLPPPSPLFTPCVCETSVWAKGKRMNRRVSSKRRVEKGRKKRNRRPHVVSTPCHQPWSQPHPHTLHFTLLTTSPAFLLLWPSLFLCCSFFGLKTRGEWFV